jgi:hypothetical protein
MQSGCKVSNVIPSVDARQMRAKTLINEAEVAAEEVRPLQKTLFLLVVLVNA